MTLGEVVAAAVTISGVITAIIVIVRKIRGAWKGAVHPAVERLETALIVLNGREAVHLPENPSVVLAPAIPGVLERMATIEDGLACMRSSVEDIKAEVTPNHGGSAKDAINRTEGKVEELTVKVEAIMTRLTKGDERFERIEEYLGVGEST